MGPVGFDVEQQALIWAMWRRGDAIREMERTLGETLPRIRRYLRESGGMPPIPRRRRVGHLSLVEREEISRGVAAGLSARMIAGRIDRPSSTVSREIARNGGRGVAGRTGTDDDDVMDGGCGGHTTLSLQHGFKHQVCRR